MSEKYWFKRRRFGLGWIPVAWQGWLALAILLLIVIGGAALLPPKGSKNSTAAMVVYLLFVLAAVNFFVALSLLKGPLPHWRWGKKPSDKKSKNL